MGSWARVTRGHQGLVGASGRIISRTDRTVTIPLAMGWNGRPGTFPLECVELGSWDKEQARFIPDPKDTTDG